MRGVHCAIMLSSMLIRYVNMLSLNKCSINSVKHLRKVLTFTERNPPNLNRMSTSTSMSRQDCNAEVASGAQNMSDEQGIFRSITDFAQLRHYKYFVDKSRMIEYLLCDRVATLIPAPSGFGKSTMLSTLKYFFEIQVNPEDGEPVTKIDLSSDELVTGTTNYDLFKGLKIAQSPGAMKEFGKRPVILVDLKAPGPVTSEENAAKIVRYAIHKCYKQHSYLLKSKKLDDSTKSFIAEWCNEEIFQSRRMSMIDYDLHNLTEFLHEHFRKECIVLVDDYDSIVMNAFGCQSVQPNELNYITSFIGGFLYRASSVCSNSHTKQIVATGILDVFPITYELRMDDNQFLEDHRYKEFYGLLESEVKELLTKSDSKIPYEDVFSYYGYTTYEGQSIFRTWSIMNFLEYQRLEPYWCRTGSIVGLYESCENDDLRALIGRLISGSTVSIRVDRRLCEYEIKGMKNFFINPSAIANDQIFFFLLNQGCLSIPPPQQEIAFRTPSDLYRTWNFKIPNTEMRKNLQLALNTFYEQHLSAYEEERARTTAAFGKIFQSIDSKEELRGSLTEYLAAMENFALKVFSRRFSISHQNWRSLVVETAKPLRSTFRLDLNVLEEFKIENGGKIDFCALHSGERRKIAIIIQFNIDKEDIGTFKDECINGHYISGLNDDNFKGAEQAIIIGLNLIKPEDYYEDPPTELELQLIYAVYQLGNDKNTNLHDTEWEILKCPLK